MDAVAECELYKWNIHLCPAVRCGAVTVALWNVGRKFPLETQVDVRIFRCFTIVTSHDDSREIHSVPPLTYFRCVNVNYKIFCHFCTQRIVTFTWRKEKNSN